MNFDTIDEVLKFLPKDINKEIYKFYNIRCDICDYQRILCSRCNEFYCPNCFGVCSLCSNHFCNSYKYRICICHNVNLCYRCSLD